MTTPGSKTFNPARGVRVQIVLGPDHGQEGDIVHVSALNVERPVMVHLDNGRVVHYAIANLIALT